MRKIHPVASHSPKRTRNALASLAPCPSLDLGKHVSRAPTSSLERHPSPPRIPFSRWMTFHQMNFGWHGEEWQVMGLHGVALEEPTWDWGRCYYGCSCCRRGDLAPRAVDHPVGQWLDQAAPAKPIQTQSQSSPGDAVMRQYSHSFQRCLRNENRGYAMAGVRCVVREWNADWTRQDSLSSLTLGNYSGLCRWD